MNRPWERGGEEPSICELLTDPICVQLRERDGLSEADVWLAVETACQMLFDIRKEAA